MKRCIDLALQGAGTVAPNPMVGCVMVHNGKIIGEGFHEVFGGPHAEVNAIRDAEKNDPELLPYSTLYVNLEPCSHVGKTPPCTDLIIEKKIPEVVIGCRDPNPLVGGVEKLRMADPIDRDRLRIDILESDCKNLNRRFFTFIEKKRPYIILKWAQTLDGLIAPIDGAKVDISNEFSRTLVHKWRSEEAAIMVGTQTASSDNPKLDTRLWKGRNPVRLVIDKTMRLPSHLHLFDHSVPTIVFTEKEKQGEENLAFVKIDFNQQVVTTILEHLYQRQIQSVLIEGGAALQQTFISANAWDEARIFIAPKTFQEGIPAPKLKGAAYSQEFIEGDQLIIVRNKI